MLYKLLQMFLISSCYKNYVAVSHATYTAVYYSLIIIKNGCRKYEQQDGEENVTFIAKTDVT